MKKSKKLTVSRKRQPSLAAAIGCRLAEGGVRVGKEVEANFRAWFERNFVNCRAGRIGHASYSRAGALDDRPGDGLWYSEALGRAWADYNDPLTASEMGYITSHPLIAFQLAAGISDVRGLRCMIRGLTQRTNRLQQKAYRGKYYWRDNARRRMLAAERRKITRRTTTNPCPTPGAFRAAFARVKDSVEAKLLFGGMVHDLACYVDSCLRYDGSGNIVGRNGGIKEWIAENVPDLYPRYKTIMRYKALAMRLRQAMGVKDPEPTSALLDETRGALLDEKRIAPSDKSCFAPDGTRAMRVGGSSAAQGEAVRDGREKGLEAGGDENYYALNSHLGGSGRDMEQAGKDGNACGLGGNARGMDGDACGMDGNASGQDGNVRGTGSNVCGRSEWPSCERMVRTRQRRERWQRRERMRRMLDGCGNTFKDVFDRIDAALGDSCGDSPHKV